MNNQAAQTMPELPDSQYRGGNDVFGKEFPLYTAAQMHQYARDYAALSQTAGVPSWIVNDLGELGVMVNGVAYFLYKGDNIVYEGAKHDDGSPMLYRMVGKREFGEVCHPLHWEENGWAAAHRYTQELIYTPGLSFGKPEDGDWRPLPAQGAAPAASGVALSSNPNQVTPGLSSESSASVSERARKIITEAIGFEFGKGELQPVNDCDMEGLAEAIEQALTQQPSDRTWVSPFGPCVCLGMNECPGCNPNEAIAMARDIATNAERRKHPPCDECGAKTAAEAETMCHCSGDKDDCHGCQLWPDTTPQPSADAVRDDRCRHENGSPGHDHWRCRDCGAFKTDSGWGVASHRYFSSRSEAEFYREHGRLPEHSGEKGVVGA